MSKNLHIFYIASWLPSKHNAFEGDFILRHAQAIALYQKVSMVYAIETDVLDNNKIVEEVVHFNQLSIYYLYLPKHYNMVLFKSKYYQSILQLYNTINSKQKVDIIHANIHWRAGLAAFLISRIKIVPFILSEHSAYFNIAYYKNKSVANYSIIKKKLTQLVLRKASVVLAVSAYLGKHIKQFEPTTNIKVVSNVVDTDQFYYLPNQEITPFVFLHASMLWPEKNINIILDAVKILSQNCNFELHLFTPIQQDIIDKIGSLGIQKFVVLKGLIAHQEMPKALVNSHASILFSDNETQGCIVIESLCCGRPVIVSKAPVFPEMIHATNGIICSETNAKQLAIAMQNMLVNYSNYNLEMIAKEANALYSMQVIGNQINEVYQSVLKV